MSENIPALIAEANLHNWGEDREDYELPSRMIHALESVSAPPGDDEREALDFDTAHDRARYAYEGRNNYGLRRAENGGIRMDEAHHSKGWEEGFRDGWDSVRRLSPLTQEALVLAFRELGMAQPLHEPLRTKVLEEWAAAILSRFALPEPAEDEWCREESCRYRHWRSGRMPTHKRGADCPPPVEKGAEQ